MSTELKRIIEQVGKEKGISKKVLIDTIKTAVLSAAKKKYGSQRPISVLFDEETGAFDIHESYRIAQNVEDPTQEVSLEEARQYNESAGVGDILERHLESGDLMNLGRIAAQTAKQVLMQRIREIERENIYNELISRKGELVSGIVQRIDRGGNIVVNIGKTDALLPSSEQIWGEHYSQGDRIRAYLLDIRLEGRGPQLILSRTHPQFLVRLFELEVPEIRNGLVEILNIAREPGMRSKVLVKSKDPNVDPAGACVGVRGSRIQNVIQEFRSERIDVIPYHKDIEHLAQKALAPCEILNVVAIEEHKTLEITVPDEQLSLAIGKKGVNVRLASKLLGWNIDIRSKSEVQKIRQLAKESVRFLQDMDEALALALSSVGVETLDDLSKMGENQFEKLPPDVNRGVASTLKRRAKELLSPASFRSATKENQETEGLAQVTEGAGANG